MTPLDPLDEFYRLIGMCIAEWAHIENYLVAICWKCLKTRIDLTSIVYYSTPQLDSRLRLVGELVHATLPARTRKDGGHDHPDVKAWNAIGHDLKDLLSTRRRVAHHSVTASLDPHLPERLNVQLEQSFTEGLRPSKGQQDPLSRDDLSRHLAEVQAVKARLIAFFETVLPKHVE